MDPTELHFQSFDICHRLYNFIKSLGRYFFMRMYARHALKTVILGPQSINNPGHLAISDAAQRAGLSSIRAVNSLYSGEVADSEPRFEFGQPNTSIETDPFGQVGSSAISDHKEEDKELPQVKDSGENVNSSADPLEGKRDDVKGKAPKKMVSISDKVEEIGTIKRKKSKKEMKRSTSLQRELEEPKPVKSILKKTSSLDEKSLSFMNPSSLE